MKAKILSFSSFSGLVLSGVLSLVPSAWPDHKVGEPQLEELPIWSVCCKDHDCVAEEVKMIGQPSDEMILVDIEGVQTAVNKQKFSPVPSTHTWVCYVDPNGSISDDNIRCILHPKPSGITRGPQKNSPLTKR
jgi:hypothetical protein